MLATDSKVKIVMDRFNKTVGPSVPMLGAVVLECMIDSFVLAIVTQQEGNINPDDIFNLKMMCYKAVNEKYRNILG